MNEQRFRMLVLGDFGARGHRGLSDSGSIGARRPRQVDRDEIDRAMTAFAPELQIALEPGAPPIAVRLTQLDDFHPDRLLERVAEFQSLIELRDRVASGRDRPADRATAAPPRTQVRPADVANLTQGSVLDLILGGDPIPTAVRPRDELSEFVQNAVKPHVVAQPTVDQQTLIAQVNDVISATMRVLLHHRHFQAVEALWRGVDFLVRRLDTGEELEVHIADVTKAELSEAATDTDSAGGRALRKLLRGEGVHGPWSLAVGLYSFGAKETALVASVAAVARTTGVPWLSGADATFVGIASFADSADPDDWDKSAIPEWDAFRNQADAKWISLAAPRVLLRVPYGKRSDECGFAFEETENGELAHEHYLWGSGALLPAFLFGDAAAAGEDSPTQGTVDGLPMFIETVDGLPAVKACAEVLLVQRASVQLLDRGLTALTAQRDGDAVRIPRIQSVASPPAPLSAPTFSEDT